MDEVMADPTFAERGWTGGDLAGWYEVEVIAKSPSLWYRSERSISVVTRYWGEPPSETGRLVHGSGGFLRPSKCFDTTGDKGGR